MIKTMQQAATFIRINSIININSKILFLPLVFILASCTPGGLSTPTLELSETFQADSSIEPSFSGEAASAEQTAFWLNNPDDVERGVWSLLENLGIGVYAQEGVQILAGSERSADDFFLFDFEVSLLASRGQESKRPFSNFHQMLVPYGLKLSEEELKTFYRSTYQAHSDLWLAQLFQSMDLEFKGDIQLTPLQEWLLFLDTFVPPTGKEMAASSKGLMSLVNSQRAQTGLCDAVRGNNADAAWGLAWQAAGTASDAIEGAFLGPMSFLDPKDLLHAIMMMMGVETKIQKSAPTAHEGHEGKGDTVTFTVSVEFTGDLPEEIVSCATILGFDVPTKGAMDGVRVEWDLGDVLGQHGIFEKGGGVMFTDSEGKSEVVWVGRHEPSGGEGEEYKQDGTIEAVVRIQQGDVFNIFAGMQEFIMPRTETTMISVGWHESDWILIMSINKADQISGAELHNNYTWEGRFSVDENYSLSGKGTVSVTGSVYFPVLDNTPGITCPPANIDGLFPFEIGGEQALESYAQVFKLEISSSEGEANIEPGGDEVCQTLKDRVVKGVVEDFVYDIMDYVPMGIIWIEAKDGKTTTIRPAEGELEVTVISGR